MSSAITKDCLLGYTVKPTDVQPLVDSTLDYFQVAVGRVRVTLAAYNELLKGDYDRYLIAGITRNAHHNKKVPPLIDSNFIREGYKSFSPPVAFKEKAKHLLHYLYDQGGNENQKFDLHSVRDSPIAYAEPSEFARLVDHLEMHHWICIRDTTHLPGQGMRFYQSVELTTMGVDEVEKTLPQIPMIGLVDQQITTGNSAVDDKINHAKTLFFETPAGTVLTCKRPMAFLSTIFRPPKEVAPEHYPV